MLQALRRFWTQFLRKSRTIDSEPLNKLSLIVIIIVDIFIAVNVFSGLADISQWHLSPTQAYPCYAEWDNYRVQTAKNKNYRDDEILRRSIPNKSIALPPVQQRYREAAEGHLGTLSTTCLQYAGFQDKVNNSANQQRFNSFQIKQTKISQLEQANAKIRSQYDSTLLEKIAGQASEKSINTVSAEQAKQELDKNTSAIATLKQEIATLQAELIAQPDNAEFLKFLKTENKFREVEKGYKSLSFWYPSIQLGFQAVFLLPLIFIAFSIHSFAQRKGYGLLSLISWHLLVIFFIPLVIKIFEFLQIGAFFEFIAKLIRTLLGGLLFLISYIYIFLIPLIGFGIIKLGQKLIFNRKSQAASRVQASRCIKCAKKIRQHDSYCSHCGFYQYIECPHCHEQTYKYLPYCKHCGSPQPNLI
jgi:hypothetical protein